MSWSTVTGLDAVEAFTGAAGYNGNFYYSDNGNIYEWNGSSETQIGSIGDKSEYRPLTVTSNGVIYTAGGATDGFNASNTAYKIDVTASSPSLNALPNLPEGLYRNKITITPNENPVTVGDGTSYVYKNGSWSSFSSKKFYDEGIAVCSDKSSRMWAFGSHATTPSNAAYRYENGGWSQISSLPTAVGYASAVYIGDDECVITGGADTRNAVYYDTVYKYDDSTDSYTTIASVPPSAQFDHGAAITQGTVFSIGGRKNFSDSIFDKGYKKVFTPPPPSAPTNLSLSLQ